MLKRLSFHLVFITIAIFLTLLTPWFREVDVFKSKKADLVSVPCGWPFAFINQNLSGYDPPYSYKVRCSFISLENPTKYYWQYFIVDVAFFYVILISLLYIVSKFKKKKDSFSERAKDANTRN